MIGLRCFKDVDPAKNFEGSSIAYLTEISFAGKDSSTLLHEVIRTGKFAHPWIGILDINVDILSEMVANFNGQIAGVEPVFNVDHHHDKGALGWHKSLSLTEKEIEVPVPNAEPRKETVVVLNSRTELTPFGQKELVELKKYRYTSAEIQFNFKRKEVVDPETEEDKVDFGAVLMGSAATNIPFIPNLAAFSAVTPRIEDMYYKLLEEYKVPSICYQKVAEELRRRQS